MGEKVKYKTPKIVKAKRGWFVALYYEYPDQTGKFKRFEISAGVNYIHDLEERECEIQSLLKEVKRALVSGFDPFMIEMEKEFIKSISEKKKELENKEVNNFWTVLEGIGKFQEFCLKKNLAWNTIRTYDSFINNFVSWVKENGLEKTVIVEVTVEVIQKFLDQQFDEEEWTPRTYNNYLKFFVTLFTRIEKLEKS